MPKWKERLVYSQSFTKSASRWSHEPIFSPFLVWSTPIQVGFSSEWLHFNIVIFYIYSIIALRLSSPSEFLYAAQTTVADLKEYPHWIYSFLSVTWIYSHPIEAWALQRCCRMQHHKKGHWYYITAQSPPPSSASCLPTMYTCALTSRWALSPEGTFLVLGRHVESQPGCCEKQPPPLPVAVWMWPEAGWVSKP